MISIALFLFANEEIGIILRTRESIDAMHQKPLSQTKKGKLIAAVAGAVGGPLGILVSPMVLMLVNAAKKEGNRFLIWAIVGIPASIGLWIVQLPLMLIIGMAMMEADAAGRNGMNDWKQMADAKNLMPNPDWCIHTEEWTQDQMDITDRVKTLRCYEANKSTPIQSDYRSIKCETEPDKERYYCAYEANRQFSEEKVIENKRRFG